MLEPRIIGTELEYGATARNESGKDISTDVFIGNIAEFAPEEYAGHGQFLRNGARFYGDIGDHPEYATPEAITITQAIANEDAGDIIVGRTAEAIMAGRQLSQDSLTLNRRVSDHRGIFWGYHENYSYNTEFRQRMLRTLALHVATRNVFAGAGALNAHGRFVVAQKAQGVTADISRSTVGDFKPLITSRDDHHCGEHLSRANVVGGDPNMSPWATRMKIGTTLLVMAMVERGWDFEHLQPLRGNSTVAKQVAGDLSLRQTVELTDHPTLAPVDIQSELCTAAQKFRRDEDFGTELDGVLEEWGKAVADLKQDPSLLEDRADWPMRLKVLQSYASKHGLRTGDPKLFGVDRLWDALRPDGIGVRLKKGLWKPWAVPDELAIQSTISPPADTRAAIRSRYIEFIRSQPQNGHLLDVNWGYVASRAGIRFPLPDPFATSDGRIEKYMSGESDILYDI